MKPPERQQDDEDDGGGSYYTVVGTGAVPAATTMPALPCRDASKVLAGRALKGSPQKPRMRRFDSGDHFMQQQEESNKTSAAEAVLTDRALRGTPTQKKLQRFDSASDFFQQSSPSPEKQGPPPPRLSREQELDPATLDWLESFKDRRFQPERRTRNTDEEWTASFIAVALVVRHAVSLQPHSGEGTGPKFGDYEAHRHWMEVTTNLRLQEWYSYDVDYWGLDYPPVMAYVEWTLGLVSRIVEPASVALMESRGYETTSHRSFMRFTVLAMDAAVCVSAVAALAKRLSSSSRLLLVALLSPPLILIDHGHFQYNCLPLGLSLWAALQIDRKRPLTAAALYCLALNSKQTALYYAPAFFFELLARSFEGSISRGVWRVAQLGIVVAAVTAMAWAPLLYVGSAHEALSRCFPFERGVFEDKVANAWYVAQVVLRARDKLDRRTLVGLAGLATLVGSFGPAAVRCFAHVRRRSRPTLKGFLWQMHLSSLAFFLFSYHVHEKSILVPLAPLSLLAFERPRYVAAFTTVATLTMAPLLFFEGLHLALFATLALYLGSVLGRALPLALLAIGLVTALPWLLPAPARFPDIYPALTALFGAAAFGCFWLYGTTLTLQMDSDVAQKKKQPQQKKTMTKSKSNSSLKKKKQKKSN